MGFHLSKQLMSVRAAYLALFFANAIFATLFKSLGGSTLATFGTFDQCVRDPKQQPSSSCMGNQLIFRASFCITQLFLLRTILSRFASMQSRRRAFQVLLGVEIPVYVGLLVGSFFIPSSFFRGYAQVARVLSGLFILFQIASIVDFSYQARDLLLDRIAQAETKPANEQTACGSATSWKLVFLGACSFALIVTAVGTAFLYEYYGSCSVGVAFATITVVAVTLLVALCITNWLDVGLLPPCVVSSYLVLMCWQALTSNPSKSCEQSGHAFSASASSTSNESSDKSMVANAIIAAFAMTWTSWRTSSAASSMFAKPPASSQSSTTTTPGTRRERGQTMKAQFSGAIVVTVDGESPPQQDSGDTEEMESEPWQFYCMMCLAGLYMAMVLTDWDSADGSSNGVSMWVKIVAQWLTILLFSWTLVAPKLFPDRDFS
ncbi:hypothetical protein Gpo141_00001086 [Globisporangium polare]